MGAPVDVLAVMDQASRLLPGSKGAVVTKIELSEARAAVAKLIDFVDCIAMGACCQTEGCSMREPMCDAVAARGLLARVQGGAA